MNKNKIKRKSPILVVLGVILALYTLFIIILFLWGFFSSLKSGAIVGPNIFRKNQLGLPQGLPWEWQWSNYVEIFDYLYVNAASPKIVNGVQTWPIVRIEVGEMLFNTLLYTFGGALVMTGVPCLTAYATAKTNFFFSKIIDAVVLIAMVVPIVGSYPSQMQVLNTLHLYNTWPGYYIQIAHCISVYYLIFQAIFKSIPITYSEAAYIEGAGEYRVLFQIILPLAMTTFFTVFLINFITIWNDYNTSMLYMPSTPSLAYAIYYVVFANGAREISGNIPIRLAGAFILLTPILILFICFRKVIMQNLSMGGLKE